MCDSISHLWFYVIHFPCIIWYYKMRKYPLQIHTHTRSHHTFMHLYLVNVLSIHLELKPQFSTYFFYFLRTINTNNFRGKWENLILTISAIITLATRPHHKKGGPNIATQIFIIIGAFPSFVSNIVIIIAIGMSIVIIIIVIVSVHTSLMWCRVCVWS